jgi:hypothetical protein
MNKFALSLVITFCLTPFVHAQTSYPLSFSYDNTYKDDCTTSDGITEYTYGTTTIDGNGTICFALKTGDTFELELSYDPATGGGELLVEGCTNVTVGTNTWTFNSDTCENANGDYLTGAVYTCAADGVREIKSYPDGEFVNCQGRETGFSDGFSIVVPADSPTLNGKKSWIFRNKREQ